MTSSLYALHLSIAELRELIEAEKIHLEKLSSENADTTLSDRIQKKATLLIDFSRQKYAASRAKELAAKIRKDYEVFTFGSESPNTDPES